MGVQVRIARVANPGGTGTEDYLNAGLTEEVKAALWIYSNPTADDTSTAHAAIGMGASIGSASAEEASSGAWRRDDVTTIAQQGFNRNDTSVDINGTLLGSDFRAVFDSFINTGTRGARLSFAIAGAGHTAGALMAGSDLSVAAGTITGTAVRGSPRTVVTGLSRLDLLIFFSAPNATIPGASGSMGHEFGACAQELDGTIRQYSVAQITNTVSGLLGAYISSDHAWTRISNTALINQVLIEGISGGDFDWSGGPSAATLKWFAFDFGERAQATVRGFTNDTASSAVPVETEFAPFFAFVAQTLLQATDDHDTTSEAGTLSYGLVDTADQFVFAESQLDGDGVTVRDVCRSYMDQAAIAAPLPATGAFGAGALKATASFSSTSVNLSYSVNDVSAVHQGFLVAIGTPGDIAQDEVVSVLDDSHAQLTGLLAPDTEVISVLDDVQAVLSAAELEPQRGTRPKTTARAGVDAAQGARPGADQLGTASS